MIYTSNKKIIGLAFLTSLFLCLSVSSMAQEIPGPMDPPRMVNDFSGFLDPQGTTTLEKKLQDFYYKTSTQIYIITVNDLLGYDPSDYAVRIGEKWGVGTKGKDNGMVILIKPKTPESRGEIEISVGYGLEGAIPDALASRIVQNEIIPAFKEGNNFDGLDKATGVLMSLSEGEYTADEYLKKAEGSKVGSIVGLIFMIILLIVIFGGGSKTGRHKHLGGNLPLWILLSMMNSGSRSHSGSFGGFSGGGGLGGFGGGGGGSFGGGGAGGSW